MGNSLEALNRRIIASDLLFGRLTLSAVKCREPVWKQEPSEEATEWVQVAVMVVGKWQWRQEEEGKPDICYKGRSEITCCEISEISRYGGFCSVFGRRNN